MWTASGAGTGTRSNSETLLPSGFAKGEAVELAVADLAGNDVFHFCRDEVDRASDFFGTRFEAAPDPGSALVVIANGALGFVDDDNLSAGFGDPDHFLDSPGLVCEEVDAADVEDAIESAGDEGQALGFGLKQVGLAAPFEEVPLEFVEHAPGDVDAIEVDVVGKEAEVSAGADGDLENTGLGLKLEFVDKFETVVGLAGQPVIEMLGEVVARSDTIVERLEFQIGSADRADEEGNAVANGIDAAGCGVAQIFAGYLEGVARVGVA
jgi:hypothetical protein